ncbi:Hypothetical_protein [Hexamita inflata]|uniref:Hypothetical_protein n=1 Tax=Hexamita inflata TaxID=28002 RepID=A0ABP1HVX7_9EUKA
MVSTAGQVYPAFVSAFISQASSISVLPFLTFSESSLVHLVTSSTLLCWLSIHQLRVDFSSEYVTLFLLKYIHQGVVFIAKHQYKQITLKIHLIQISVTALIPDLC